MASDEASQLERDRILAPNDPRAAFDIAHADEAAGHWAQARAWYQWRAGAGEQDEDAWYAALRAALCAIQLGEWELGVGELLVAWGRRPDRAEPLYELARSARFRGMHHLAILAAEQALCIPRPADDAKWFNAAAYRDGPLEELSISAWYAGRRQLGLEACTALQHSTTAPPWTREQASANATHYAQPLEATRSLRVEIPEAILAPDFSASTGTICRSDGGYVVINRLLNYDVSYDESKALYFISRDSEGRFRSRNAWVTFDRDLNQTSVQAIDHSLLDRISPTPLDQIYNRGIEDFRLVRWNDAWWFTACSCQFDPHGLARQALGRLDEAGTTIIHLVALEYERSSHVEKNWLPFVHDNRLLLLYACHPTVILEPDPETGVCREVQTTYPPADLSNYRGSAQPIPWGDGYLFSVHETPYIGNERIYQHRFVEMDSAFSIRRISPYFTFRHSGVEFSCGHCLSHDERSLLITHSWEEQQSWLIEAPVDEIERMLILVDDLCPGITSLVRLHAS